MTPNPAVMLDGLGGWYLVPGADIATAKFRLPAELTRHGPRCDEPHPVGGYKCTEYPKHVGAWHYAADGRYLLARWKR